MPSKLPIMTLLVFICIGNSAFAARTTYVTFSPTTHSLFYWNGGNIDNRLQAHCTIWNPNSISTAPSQHVTVTPIAVADTAHPWSDVNTQNNVVSTLPTISFTLANQQSYEMGWLAKNNSAVNFPKGLTISVTESAGFLMGSCTIQLTEGIAPIAGSSFNLNDYIFGLKEIAVNNGHPF